MFQQITFILNVSSEYCTLVFPKIQFEFLTEIISLNSLDNMPKLPVFSMEISCLDIQNKRYTKNTNMCSSLREGMRDKNGSGYCVFDLVVREK